MVGRLLGDAVPNLMVTDPPYGVSYDPTWRHRLGVNNSARVGKVQNDDIADWSEAWALFPGRCTAWVMQPQLPQTCSVGIRRHSQAGGRHRASMYEQVDGTTRRFPSGYRNVNGTD
jgi:hypothetical protein